MKIKNLLALFFMFFISCDNEKSVNPIYTQPKGKIKATHPPNIEPDNWCYYYYDQKENLIKTETKKDNIIQNKTVYSYNTNNQIKTISYYLHKNQFTGYEEFLYDESNLLYKKNHYGTAKQSVISYTLFEYDADNTLINETTFSGDTDNKLIEKKLEYINSKIASESYTAYTSGTGTVYEQYILDYIYDGNLLIEKRITESLTYENGSFELFKYNNISQLIERTQIFNRNDSENTRQIITIYEYF